tara:strand:- start:819 stop:1046 length:228 start_codon:yes stop_codon:yes gene_type:complete
MIPDLAESSSPRVGDILTDRNGNKMVIVDLVDRHTGDCYVLLNGRVKLVNTQSPFIIKSELKNQNQASKMKQGDA